MSAISSLSVGCRNIALLLSFEKYSEKMFIWVFYASFGSFSYRGKVIIKDVSNIGIGYSIAIIKGQSSWYTGCYSF